MSDSKDDGEAAPGRRRRSWSLDEKRRIVDESLEDGASLAEVARRHDLNANQLFTWRRQFGVEATGPRDMAPILPVTIALETAAEEPGPGSSGQIEIVLTGGDRILVWSDVETAALMRVFEGVIAAMIPIPSGVRVWIATGHTDMRRGMQGLALQVQESLKRDPHAGDLYIFRGRRGDLAKILWHDGIGLSLYAKRLDRGKFIWPSASGDAVSISAAQMAYMLEGIDWRNPQLTWRPTRAG